MANFPLIQSQYVYKNMNFVSFSQYIELFILQMLNKHLLEEFLKSILLLYLRANTLECT